MSGLRFESMADMPPRMREAYARQMRDLSGAAALATLHKESHGKTKYGSRKDTRGELRFASQKEARRYDELMVMLRAGIISDLRLQPPIHAAGILCDRDRRADPRGPVHGGLFLPIRRKAGRRRCEVQADTDKGVFAQPEIHAGQIRDRDPGGLTCQKKTRAARARHAGCRSRAMPVRMQSSRRIFARGAAGTRMSTRGGRRCR